MNIKFLTTTLVSMSLLSMNLFASGTMKCNGNFCMVKIEKPSPKVDPLEKIEVPEIKYNTEENRSVIFDNIETEGYNIVLIDNIETIIFPHSDYVMTEDEIAEYELNQMQKSLTTLTLNSDLPLSDFLCEDDLKPIKVAGIENTYECS